MDSPLRTPLDQLYADRTSAKWSAFDPAVLPAWVAEMDSTLAPPVAAALHGAIDRSDTGYAGWGRGPHEAFAGFAARRWDWSLDPAEVRAFADVGVAITEVLRQLVSPGDGVVITTPVYPSFFRYFSSVGAHPVEVPLLEVEQGGRLDLAGIDAAFEAGARVLLLCSPHNPTGRVHTRQELTQLAAIAERHGATVLADEIHAPLTYPGETFTPYLSVADRGLAFHSPSKAWNLAGLKTAFAVGDFPVGLSDELVWGTGQLGLVAAQAAFAEGEPWLDLLLADLQDNAVLLDELLRQQLPEVGYHQPRASFLAWLDCRELGLGDDPAQAFLSDGQVALGNGPMFGDPGRGWARLNTGTTPDVLTEAVRRMALLR